MLVFLYVDRAQVGLRFHPRTKFRLMQVGQLTQAERQSSLERLGMAFGHELVTGGTTLLLRAFRAKQVTEARGAPQELARGGEFEPLGNGLLCLLHGERTKTETAPPLGKAFVLTVVSYLKLHPYGRH